MLIDIVYENGPIKFFCISAVLMLDVSIDTGLRTFLHLISIYKYIGFVVFDVFDRQGNFYIQSLNLIFMLNAKKISREHKIFTIFSRCKLAKAIQAILLIQLQYQILFLLLMEHIKVHLL